MTAPVEIRNHWYTTANYKGTENGWTTAKAHEYMPGVKYTVSMWVNIVKTGDNPSLTLYPVGITPFTITSSQRITFTTEARDNGLIGLQATMTDCIFVIVKPVCVRQDQWALLTSLGLPDNFFNYATLPEQKEEI